MKGLADGRRKNCTHALLEHMCVCMPMNGVLLQMRFGGAVVAVLIVSALCAGTIVGVPKCPLRSGPKN